MDIKAEALIIVLIGLFGNIIFKLGAEGFGRISFETFLTWEFYQSIVSTRYGLLVIIAFLIGMVGKILVLGPLSRMKFGIVFAFLAPMSLALTTLVGWLIFRESYTVKEVLGLTLAFVSVFLLGGE